MKKSQVRRRHHKRRRRTVGIWLKLPMLLVGVLAIVGTVMYLTTQTVELTNAFTVGKNTIQIVEPDINPDAVEWGSEMKPVKLRNPGEADNAPGVVRAMLIPYLTDADTGDRLGGDLGGLTEPVGNTMALGDVTFHFANDWSNNWFYMDGFFYYRKVLSPGEETTKLLTGVTLSDAKAGEYTDKRVKIDVMADILQTEGDAPSTEWGVTVSGDSVLP